MRICLISYFFPPNNSSGAQRWSKFVKYLSRRGHDLCVISAVGELFGGEDSERGIEMNGYARVYRFFHRVPHREPFIRDSPWGKLLKFFIVPDSRTVFFIKHARRIYDIIKKERPDVLIATAPPYSALVFGSLLSRVSGIPFVADLRDPWLNNPQRTNKLADYILEMFSLRGASAVLVINPRETFEEARRFNKNVFVIEHVYDPEDYNLKPYEHRGEVWVSHIGSLYSPYQRELLLSLKELLPKGFVLKAVGPGSESVGGVGAVARKEAFRYMLSSEVLLLLIRVSSKKARYGSSVRFYDYLGSGKPVVVSSDNPFVAQKAREMGFEVVDFSAESVARAVLRAVAGQSAPKGKRRMHRVDVAVCEVERILQRVVSTRSSSGP